MPRALAAFIACLVLAGGPARAAPPTVAVFDFELVNTSLQPTSEAERDRLGRLGAALRAALDRSGRYRVVAAPTLQAGRPTPRDCNDCALAAARAAGAALAAYGWVQKVSNLILNINLVIEDAASARHVAAGSVDIRGNTDESWQHGLRFLLREHVLPD